MLFDFYGALLTEKQQEFYVMHHDEDCSLAEIGEVFSITPQAVADMLKRTDKKLNFYEEKLGLVKKHNDKLRIMAKITALGGEPWRLKI